MNSLCAVRPAENTTEVIRNPYMGWSVYVEYACTLHEEHGEGADGACIDADYPELFFARLDREIEKGLLPAVLYIRVGWIWFEPHKGEYAWRNPESLISRYIAGAQKRKLQIAFRILTADDYYKDDDTVDDTKQCTPPWLFHEPGFQYYINWEGNRTPYYDNPTYFEHYERLVRELAVDFDRPDLVAFADAQGLGVWGEMHDIKTEGRWNIEQTIEEHAKIWTKYFHHILLGACFGGGAEEVNRRCIVPEYRHMVRRDGYGSRWITPEFTDVYLNECFPQRVSSYAEVCYWHLNDRKELKLQFDQEQELSFTGDLKRDLREYFELCITHVQKFRANVMDARVPSDWPVWTELGQDLIRKFAMENGYRLVPVHFEFPQELRAGENWSVSHRWKNTGLGFLPIVNNQLSGKYRISFALLGEEGTVKQQWIDNEADPSWILEDGEVGYQATFSVPEELEKGAYRLAVGIVDTTAQNQPALNLATQLEAIAPYPNRDAPCRWFGNWYILAPVQINS